MKLTRKQLGQQGEDLVSEYLQNIGYRILYRNYRCRHGEIDIIAEEGGDLVFVEVRARRSANFGTAAESVNFRKQQKLHQLALFYISIEGQPKDNYRFDVAAVTFDGTDGKVELIKNAF